MNATAGGVWESHLGRSGRVLPQRGLQIENGMEKKQKKKINN
jgi:hypothetical protein